MDLVRAILLEVEKFPFDRDGTPITIEGHTEDEVQYHLILLDQAGLVTIDMLTYDGGALRTPIGLTWAGHEFLDAARNNTTWNRAKHAIVEKGGAVSFEILKAYLTAKSRELLGLPPG
jgi:hypothetical protein